MHLTQRIIIQLSVMDQPLFYIIFYLGFYSSILFTNILDASHALLLLLIYCYFYFIFFSVATETTK